MWQQGQVFKLKAKSTDGQPLWAYRYRLDGRGLARPLNCRPEFSGFFCLVVASQQVQVSRSALASLARSPWSDTALLGIWTSFITPPPHAVNNRSLLAQTGLHHLDDGPCFVHDGHAPIADPHLGADDTRCAPETVL